MKKKIIFVGSFPSETKSSLRGGLTTACQYILESEISDRVEWILIDSTAPHNQHRSFLQRLLPALRRVAKFLWALIAKSPTTALVFTTQGFGFYEKGLMIIMAKLFGKETILAPRSGFIINDIKKSKAFKRRAGYILNKSDVIICQGTFWKTFFETEFGISSKKLIVIHNGIDASQFAVGSNAANDNVTVLFMAWIEKNKGVYDLVKAMELLRNLKIEWHIAGEGMALDEIKSQVAALELQDVHFLGWLSGDEKKRALGKADIFILPSYHEGMPNALLEAMSSGKAAISTTVGAIPDLIRNGENGYLIEPGDISELAERIQALTEDHELRKAFGERARKSIEQEFSLDVILPKFQKLLTSNIEEYEQ